MKSFARSLTTLALSSFLIIASAFASGPIHDTMKDIGRAFKTISKDLKVGKISVQSVAAGQVLVDGFTALEGVTPSTVPDGTGGERAITPEEAAIYTQMNSEMLALATTLLPQLEAGDMAAAAATVQLMNEAKSKAHDLFKP